MVVVGLATIFTAPLPPVALWISVGGMLLLTVFLFVYSYRVWAADPSKHPIGRRPVA